MERISCFDGGDILGESKICWGTADVLFSEGYIKYFGHDDFIGFRKNVIFFKIYF
jgi:hypothetical protein